MNAPVINVRQELADAPASPQHWLLAALISLTLMFDGYDVFNSAYVGHYVKRAWHLIPSQMGFLISSGLIGFTIGALAQGPVADRFGRRLTLIIGLTFAGLFSLVTAMFANSFESFCILRFVTGLGLGVLMPIGVTYVNEIAPRSISNVFATLGWLLGWAGGGIVASAIGVYLTPAYGWQVLFYAGSSSLVLAVFLVFLLPDSPLSMVARGDTRGLAGLLRRLNPARADRYGENVRYVLDEETSKKGSIAALFAPRYRRNTIVIWIAAFLVLFSLFGLTGWIPNVMMQRGETFAVSFGFGALLQIMSVLGQLTGGSIADRTGDRRPIIMIFWAIGAASVMVLALMSDNLVNWVCTSLAGFFIIGAQGLLSNWTASVYETEVRATGVGMELGIGRIGAILGPYVVGLLQQAFPGSFAMFAAIALATILAVVVMAFARHPGEAPSALAPHPAA